MMHRRWQWQAQPAWRRSDRDSDDEREGPAALTATGMICLAITLGATFYAFKTVPNLSLRKAPEFIRVRNVEHTFRGLWTLLTDTTTLMPLLGAAVATLVVGMAVMRTVNTTVEAGWLGFIPTSNLILTAVGFVVVTLFGAGARLYALPMPEGEIYVDMALSLMFMTIGVLCALIGKTSQM